MTDFDVVVIGGGPAGMAAALAAEAEGARTLVIERDNRLGGILNQCIHAGFGLHYFGEELTGPEYAGRFVERVEKSRVQVSLESMVLSLTDDRQVTYLSPDTGISRIKAGAVVLAMGCRERTAGAIGLAGTRPAGVYTAGAARRGKSAQWAADRENGIAGGNAFRTGAGSGCSTVRRVRSRKTPLLEN